MHVSLAMLTDFTSCCRFLTSYMLAAEKGQPVVVTGAMSAWPALSRWQDLAYLTRVAGPRTVPVEMGRHYLAQGWGQHLMLFSDFVKLHVQIEAAQADARTDSLKPVTQVRQSQVHADSLEHQPNTSTSSGPTCRSGTSAEDVSASETETEAAFSSSQGSQQHRPEVQAHSISGQEAGPAGTAEPQHCQQAAPSQAGAASDTAPQAVKGYLAQHPLFDQIPALRNDIQEPAYCILGEGTMQSINAWFGPGGTVSHSAFCFVTLRL